MIIDLKKSAQTNYFAFLKWETEDYCAIFQIYIPKNIRTCTSAGNLSENKAENKYKLIILLSVLDMVPSNEIIENKYILEQCYCDHLRHIHFQCVFVQLVSKDINRAPVRHMNRR